MIIMDWRVVRATNQTVSDTAECLIMGSGGSKSNSLEIKDPGAGGGRLQERRHSHVDTNPPPLSNVLVECPICKRSFAADRIGRHKEVPNLWFYCSLEFKSTEHENGLTKTILLIPQNQGSEFFESGPGPFIVYGLPRFTLLYGKEEILKNCDWRVLHGQG